MFGCVAAWGVAACLVLWPVASGVETVTFANADGALVIATPAAFPGEAEIRAAAAPHIALQAPDLKDADSPLRTDLAVFDPPALESLRPAVPEPFGLAAVPVASGNVLSKWNGVEAAIRKDRETLARCRDNADDCPRAARDFLAVIAEGRAATGRSRIGVINRAVNMAIRPMSDMAQWGVPDRWSPPLETFTTGRGDCEDYAIAKYVALTEAGMAIEDVKLLIVRNTAAGEDHAVVAVRFDGDWLILDNRWLMLVEDTGMRQAVPLFVLDQDGVRRFEPATIASMRRPPAPASVDF